MTSRAKCNVAFLYITVFLFLTFSLSAQEISDNKPLSFFGEIYTEAAASVSDPFTGKDISDSSFGYDGVTSFELDAIGGDLQHAKVEASVIFKLFYGDSTGKINSAIAGSTDSNSQAIVIADSNGAALAAEIKKLYLSVFTQYVDISLGRMIINYGRGAVFSPVDLFATVDITDIDLGRIGTDAARFLIPAGAVSGIDLMTTLAATVDEFTTGGRVFGNIHGWDFGLSAFRDGRDTTSGAEDWVLSFGLDFKGDAILGIYGEALVSIPWESGAALPDNTVWSVMGGVDYSISGEWFFNLEYLLNTGNESYRSGTFRADHNLYASVLWKINEATSLAANSIINIQEEACQGIFSFSRNIASNTALLGYLLYRNGNIEQRFMYNIGELLAFVLRVTVAF